MSEYNNSLNHSGEPLSISKAVSSLKAALRRYRECDGVEEGRLRIFSESIEPTELSEWLSCQTIFPKLFWMNREKDFSVAGIGIADSIICSERGENAENFMQLGRAVALKDPAARYFGGFHFNNEEEQNPIWKEFSSFSFVLPLIQLTFEHGRYALSCHLSIEKSEERDTKITALEVMLEQVVVSTSSSELKLPELLKISYNPQEQEWLEKCTAALQTFEEGSMEKIMLARQTTLEFRESFSPMLFLLRYPYPQNTTYRFYFEPVEHHAFLSFTPERLYRRDGRQLLTEALAGTCSKESITGDEEHASEALLNSEKDIREHRFVRDMIFNELTPICSDIDMEEEVQVLQLNRLAHLYTRCSATLKPEFQSDSTLLTLLHPTPAVGGVPKEPALRHIMNLEPFSRGWYAAPLGWISRDAAEFCVGIRSALVNGPVTFLYSGAGLVKGSDPYSEWEEVDQKIGDILAITRQEV